MSTLRKVQRGDPLRIPAETFNAFIDSAVAHRSRELEQTAVGSARTRHNILLPVRNDSDEVIARFSVLGIDNVVTEPSVDSLSFQNQPVLVGILPSGESHQTAFVVTIEPLDKDAVGLAVVMGVTPARVQIDNTNHRYARVVDGSTVFESAEQGPVQLLWRENGTGTKWALVEFPARAVQEESDSFWARITGRTAQGANRWRYTIVEVHKTGAGHGGWTTLSGGRTGSAYNTIEEINDAAGVQGNGVNADHLVTDDYEFALQPCPTGNIVRIYSVTVGGQTEYWFAYENGVDGSCLA